MPQSLWGKNLRTALGRDRWDTLRLRVAHKSCIICGSTEQLESHEVWDYRDRPRISVAKLLRIDTTCTKCHDVIHWGNTIRLADEGKISKRAIIGIRRHFRTVNKCTQKDFERHIVESTAVAIARSGKQWRIDWGSYHPPSKKRRKPARLGRPRIRCTVSTPTIRLPAPVITCRQNARCAASIRCD